MLNNTLIPFFPLKIVEKNQTWTIHNPLSDIEYNLGYDGYCLLFLCNGYNTWAEITEELSKKFQLTIAEVNSHSETIMEKFTQEGIIWWRKERMQISQTAPPISAIWDLTYKCNLSCYHCVVNAGRKRPSELNLKESKNLIDELASFGIKNLVLTGGEPLTHPNFFKITEYAINAGLSLQISTNGTMITSKIARKLAAMKPGIQGIQVSLDGLTPEIHNQFRKNKDAWKLAIKGIKNLVKAKIPVTLGSVVTKTNYNQILDLYKFANELKVSYFRIMPFVPYGRGRKNSNLEVSPMKMMELTKKLYKLQKLIGLPITPMQFECLMSPPPTTHLDIKTHLGCEGGILYCTINANGDILPCNFFAGVKTENIREKSFEWIWKNSLFLNYMRSLTISDIDYLCQSCPWIPACRGSCIAMNFAKGNIFQANRQCWRIEALQRELRRSKSNPCRQTI